MSQTVSDAVAKRDDSPSGLIRTYSADFASVLPAHIKAETWVRLAQGALRKGKRSANGRFELEEAAANNPGTFLAALLDAARQGLTPGSEEFYLTPRKVKGRLEILGITGYQGYVELMYRAGAIGSVVVQVVHEHDEYEFAAGQLDRETPPRWQGPQEVPYHRHRSFARDAERGKLVGVYAYARMKDGAVSQVVELNQDDINRIKAVSQGADGEYSPWVKWEKAMWLKSAARQLRKWVPTSAEYRREVLRASAEAHRVATARDLPAAPDTYDDDPIDGEVISEQEWPDVAAQGGAADGG